MKEYVQQRLTTYMRVIFGLVIGLVAATFLFDQLDYKTAGVAILFGLIAGELMVFSKWKKGQNNL